MSHVVCDVVICPSWLSLPFTQPYFVVSILFVVIVKRLSPVLLTDDGLSST